MKYRVQYQYRPKGNDRPLDYGQEFELTGGPEEFLLLPNIGDHVSTEEQDELDGVVENRLFSYVRLGGEVLCIINIVLTDSDVPAGQLLKE